MAVIRVDPEVKRTLERRRLDGERNYTGAITRALDEQRLEAQLAAGGLTTAEMSELAWLRRVRL